MASGLFDKQQNRYPEGKVFAYALFALAVIEQGAESDRTAIKRAQMVDASIRALMDKYTLDNFNEQLDPPYGAYYNGWTNLVLRRYLSSDLYQYSKKKELCRKSYQQICNRLISAKIKTSGLLETYTEGYWPADNIVAMTSLPDSSTIKTSWANEILSIRDDSLGLILHGLDDRQLVRGCSQAMIQYFLTEYSYAENEKDYQVFSEAFVDDYGVQFVREYSRGRSGKGDIDSGPLVLGYGSAATVMHVKTGKRRGEKMNLTWGLMNLLGAPINIFGKKFYLFNQEPMFDLFMLWVGI